MSDYISREAAIDYLRKEAEECRKAFEELGGESGIYADAYNDLAEDFHRIPAADVEPVRHGRWIPCYERLPEKSGVYLVAYIATGTVDRLRFYTQYGTGLRSKKNVWVGVIYPYTSNMGVEVIYDNVTHWMPLPKPPKEE